MLDLAGTQIVGFLTHRLIYLFLGGRVAADQSLSSVERYDPARDRWDEVAPLSSPRRCVAVGCLAGKMYAVGGSGNHFCISFTHFHGRPVGKGHHKAPRKLLQHVMRKMRN